MEFNNDQLADVELVNFIFMLQKVFSKKSMIKFVAVVGIAGFLAGCGSTQSTQRMPQQQPGSEQQDPQQQSPGQQDPGQQPQQQDPGGGGTGGTGGGGFSM